MTDDESAPEGTGDPTRSEEISGDLRRSQEISEKSVARSNVRAEIRVLRRAGWGTDHVGEGKYKLTVA